MNTVPLIILLRAVGTIIHIRIVRGGRGRGASRSGLVVLVQIESRCSRGLYAVSGRRGRGRGGFEGQARHDEAIRRGGDERLVGDAEDFTDIEVPTVVRNLRVVGHQHGGVNGVLAGNEIAVVPVLNFVGSLAILACQAEAQALAYFKIRACLVEDGPVRHGELVSGRVLSKSDPVTMVPYKDCVTSGTSGQLAGSCRCERGRSKNGEERRSEHDQSSSMQVEDEDLEWD